MTMIKKIIERGFKPSNEEKDTYVRGNWTIRFDNEVLEAFNNPDLEPGRTSAGVYYSAPLHKIDLDILLDEIDNKSLEKL